MSASPTSRPVGRVHYDNQQRVVLVSGGAQGIGQAICQAFHESGARVLCLDVAPPSRENDSRFRHLMADTSHEESCAAAVDLAVGLWGGLDVLVNNAAIQPPDSYVPLDQLERSAWERMLAVNLSGYNFLAKHAVRQMLRQRSGTILNISSGQGHRTTRGVPCYGPIKAANLMQTRQWGVEYARHGIRVVSVSPGAIDTPLVRASLAEQGGAEALANRHPLADLVSPRRLPRRCCG